MNIQEITAKMKQASYSLAAFDVHTRNLALQNIADALLRNQNEIFRANRIDLDRAKSQNLPDSVIKRLRFDEHKLQDVIAGINGLISLEDPLGKQTLKRELDAGLTLIRESVPIGVVGIIFEARPDALVQISALCIKSGNCAVLKGGTETMQTNKALFDRIHKAVTDAGLPEYSLHQIEAREEIQLLLDCHDTIDLLIPRGSNAFVQYIMQNTQIPVMGHSDGICHMYIDKFADMQKAVRILIDGKTQYTAACNAVETLLVHEEIAKEHMHHIVKALLLAGVEVRLDPILSGYVETEHEKLKTASPEDDSTEYLDMILSVKSVKGIDDAISHINTYGSHHTDCIITENPDRRDRFMRLVDSAGVYHNCSTRFADGFRYGFGAEVGISTGKLHARGPVGLDGLCTYKYKLFGNGDIVSDYALGTRSFHFRDLETDPGKHNPIP